MGTGSPQTWPYTHFCSVIMGVKKLYVPNSLWIQGPVSDGTGSTGPDYLKMTISLKDAAGCGDRVTPNLATYAFLFSHYVCKGAMCTKWPLEPGTHNWWYGLYRVLATLKWPSALRTRQFVGTGSPQTWPHSHFCSAIMCVNELCVPNIPWTQGPIADGTGWTGSSLP